MLKKDLIDNEEVLVVTKKRDRSGIKRLRKEKGAQLLYCNPLN